ncbi:MAG: hypothetical protein ACSHXK_08375 [Oceanococcus sp.]
MLKKTAALLLLASSSAIAADPTIGFNHLGARYISADANGADGDGFGIDLKFALTNYLYVDLDYSTRSLEAGGSSVDVEYFSGGLGGNYALNEAKTIQLFGGLSWEQLQLDGATAAGGGGGGEEGGGGAGGCDFTGTPLDQLFSVIGGILPICDPNAKALTTGGNPRTDGIGATIGVRALVWENLEVAGHYDYREYENFEESVMGLDAGYSFGNWGAVFSYDTYDEFDMDEFSLGVRYTFGSTDEGSSSIW